jgi:beta-glucanase (GH16 family)
MVVMRNAALLRSATLALSVLALGACADLDADDESAASSEDELKDKKKKKKDDGKDDKKDDEPKPEDPNKCGGGIDWQPHMFEEFDAWNDGRFTKFHDRVPPRTSTCYVADNVQVSNGKLRLLTKKGVACQGQPHSGGAVDTYGKFWTGKYFKAEVRVKVSQQQGIFGAPLWFRPGNGAGALGVGGEIDVVEVLGTGSKFEKAKFHQTLHPDYADTQSVRVHESTPFSAVGDELGEGWHTYTVEKVPNGMTFYVDGKRTAGWGCGHPDNAARPPYYKEWFETPEGWSIRIDQKVGGEWAGEPDHTTMWGTETAMVIEYLKVWRPKP